ncbi:MAG: ATP-binding cassette domain-containing protein, partial [Actinomycetota bacterium]|nr:ATP-binding cassette domain-containing protein [Actinomycetota bacterium]
EYGRLHDRFATLGGYSLEVEAKRILAGLGFRDADLARPTESFSGGWLMRIALAKLLLAAPDVLMLDEPTNHLDVESVEWLERFLKSYDGAVLLISHDRDFINGIATRVVEIWDRKLITYTGDYESFTQQRELAERQATAQAAHQARQRQSMELFINRFRYKKTKARQVQSRIKMLERLEPVEDASRKAKVMKLGFPQPPRPGRVVAELEQVHFGYGDVPVYAGLDLVIERDDKVALVGPNGAGKTTLLKLFAGVLTPQSGRRRLGHKVELGYFAQHQIEALDDSKRVIEELESSIPRGLEVKPRNLLGRFLFSGDDVEKRVDVLSGGERTRLALAKLLVSPANFLCLDEPTNHLDIPSRDALEDALEEYSGSLVLITHDRHLIRNVANRVVEVRAGRVKDFVGDYDYYLSKREAPSEEPRSGAASKPGGPTRKEERRIQAAARGRTKKLRDRVATIERELTQLSRENERLAAILADPESYSSGDGVADLVRDFNSNKRRSQLLEEEWAEATSALETAMEGS